MPIKRRELKKIIKANQSQIVTAAYRVTFTDLPSNLPDPFDGKKASVASDADIILKQAIEESGDWVDLHGVITKGKNGPGLEFKFDFKLSGSTYVDIEDLEFEDAELNQLMEVYEENSSRGGDWGGGPGRRSDMANVIAACYALEKIHKSAGARAEIVPLSDSVMVRYGGPDDLEKCKDALSKAGFKWSVGG